MARMLSEMVADDIMMMITMEKRFVPGERLPSENHLSAELNVSRATLREAIRILSTRNVLEIKRGKGTFVRADLDVNEKAGLEEITTEEINIRELYEMRLIFEPEAVYYAAKRATENELKNIMECGRLVEEKILKNEDRMKEELEFHQAIAKATHNGYMNKLLPILFQGVIKGVKLSEEYDIAVKHTIDDHRLIMKFLECRDADGARTAMRLHTMHAMQDMKIV